MWIDWLRQCNQQHKAAEEPFSASYWNSGSGKPRVTQGTAKKLPVYGIPRAHAVSGTAVSGTAVSGTAVSCTEVSGTAVSGTAVSGTAVSGTEVSGTAVSGTAVSGTAVSGTI